MSISLTTRPGDRSVRAWLPITSVLWGWLPAVCLSIVDYSAHHYDHPLFTLLGPYAAIQWWLVPALVGLIFFAPCGADGRVDVKLRARRLRNAAIVAALPALVTTIAVTFPRSAGVMKFAAVAAVADLVNRLLLTYSPVIAAFEDVDLARAYVGSILMMRRAAAIGMVVLGLGLITFLPLIWFPVIYAVTSDPLAGQMISFLGYLACGGWTIAVVGLVRSKSGGVDRDCPTPPAPEGVRIVGDVLFAAWLASLVTGLVAAKLPLGVLAWGTFAQPPWDAYTSHAPFSVGGMLVPATCTLVIAWFLRGAPVPTIASTAICKLVFLTNWRIVNALWVAYALLAYIGFAGFWVLVLRAAKWQRTPGSSRQCE